MTALHVCPACGSALVQLVAQDESESNRWWLTLRCPECETISAGEFDQTAVEALERELERGAAELEANYLLLVQANMADALDRFLRALEADAIQPIDF
ncbi:MAG TPA: hypothetical protein VF752_04965 [Thermoleophilaceae bacterium]